MLTTGIFRVGQVDRKPSGASNWSNIIVGANSGTFAQLYCDYYNNYVYARGGEYNSGSISSYGGNAHATAGYGWDRLAMQGIDNNFNVAQTIAGHITLTASSSSYTRYEGTSYTNACWDTGTDGSFNYSISYRDTNPTWHDNIMQINKSNRQINFNCDADETPIIINTTASGVTRCGLDFKINGTRCGTLRSYSGGYNFYTVDSSYTEHLILTGHVNGSTLYLENV